MFITSLFKNWKWLFINVFLEKYYCERIEQDFPLTKDISKMKNQKQRLLFFVVSLPFVLIYCRIIFNQESFVTTWMV